MSTTTNGGSGAAAQPQMNVLGQYIKDLSFENPNTPRPPMQTAPEIAIQINLGSRQLSDTDFEVELKIEGKAQLDNTVLFAVDLSYGGLFRLQNIPPEHLTPLLYIEAPRLLFPFAREIIASAVMQGGFPPLMLEPVDFAALYQQRMAQGNQAQPTLQA